MRGTTDWIQTYTGRMFWPLEPLADEVSIDDIAHALSQMCRFTGHCAQFYSVAEHSVRVSFIVPIEDAMWALLHDASEAYLHDLPRPLKRAPVFGELYKQHEARLMAVICEHFGLPAAEPPSVKEADTVLLITERRDLMAREPEPWKDQAEPLREVIHPWHPAVAKKKFINRFKQLETWRGSQI